jgi:hypothetical protein
MQINKNFPLLLLEQFNKKTPRNKFTSQEIKEMIQNIKL